MKAGLLILFLLGLSSLSLAQSSTVAGLHTTVRGSVSDAAGKALPFASIALLNARDSTLAKGGVTSEAGTYELTGIRPGRYVVMASSIGYKPAKSAVFEVAATPVDVLVLPLSESAKTLNEVAVVTKKPFVEQEADRTVINVAGSIIGSGSTALEVLEKAPGVTVDRQNDALQLRGKDGVIVQIDGKQTYLSMQDVVNLLKNMPSDNIEKIDLITNPGARYDAAGNSGIINIRLKKNNNVGTNGSASLTGGSGRFDRERTSLQLNHRESKVNLFGSYGLNRGGNYWNFTTDRDQPAQGDGTGAAVDLTKRSFVEQNTYLVYRDLGQNAKAGLDYMPTKNTTIGLVWTAFWNNNDQRGPAIAQFRRGSDQPVYLQTETAKTQITHTSNQLVNLNFQHTLTAKDGKSNNGQLAADLDMGHYQREFTTTLLTATTIGANANPNSLTALDNRMPTTVDIRSVKADYSRTLPGKWKLDLGVKSTSVKTDNNLTIFTGMGDNLSMDPSRSNQFQYTEQVNAGYVSLSGKWAGQTDVQVGLRAEHTHSEGNSITLKSIVERNYLNWFPSLFISRPIAKNQTLAVSYSYRIDRPSYQNLNPSRSFVDPYAFQEGNPYLRPQYTHSLEVKHGFNSKVFTSLGASFTSDLVFIVAYPLDGNKVYYIVQNIGKSQAYNLTVSFPVTVTKGWTMQTTLLGFYNQFDYNYQESLLSLSQFSGRLNSSSAIVLGKGWTAELSGRISAPSVYAIWSSPWLGSVDAGLQKAVNAKLKVKLSGQDLVHTNRTIATMNTPTNIQHIRMTQDTRLVLLNLSYTFGNQKLKAARQRRTAAEEEMQRAN
ncbi:outer membrane beta-barrel protein [Fibrella arboris]|uniref:outer membrane beta-barrel protein n=1 Tax=Fibrella arboris TaxID=3242486 RepID=UPI0035220669